jgi:hypothetical protein
MMRCLVCYHNAACFHGLCAECVCVVYAHQPANMPPTLNSDPLGLHRLALNTNGEASTWALTPTM